MTDDEVFKRTFVKASNFLGIQRVQSSVVLEYLNLVKRLKREKIDTCDKARSSPVIFWSIILKKFEDDDQIKISNDLRKIILTACITPLGSAQGP